MPHYREHSSPQTTNTRFKMRQVAGILLHFYKTFFFSSIFPAIFKHQHTEIVVLKYENIIHLLFSLTNLPLLKYLIANAKSR